jgi:hypothetical protein
MHRTLSKSAAKSFRSLVQHNIRDCCPQMYPLFEPVEIVKPLAGIFSQMHDAAQLSAIDLLIRDLTRIAAEADLGPLWSPQSALALSSFPRNIGNECIDRANFRT